MHDTIADHIWHHNIFARPTRDRKAGVEEATSDQERHYWNREKYPFTSRLLAGVFCWLQGYIPVW